MLQYLYHYFENKKPNLEIEVEDGVLRGVEPIGTDDDPPQISIGRLSAPPIR